MIGGEVHLLLHSLYLIISITLPQIGLLFQFIQVVAHEIQIGCEWKILQFDLLANFFSVLQIQVVYFDFSLF
jgi:hypothetical protein